MIRIMNNIWSENKYLNIIINILLFLVGINFLHYGQLILPIICFILFIDNKLQFKVNSPKTFIILCLFAVSFYGFTYKLGFYSVMGFTFPMAYYIGSNMKNPNEDNIKKVVYLIAISMGCHIILSSIYEFIVHGARGFFMSSSHYDVWTRKKIANTTTAVNADILIGCLYYLILHEKNKRVKTVFLVVFALSIFYLLVIGRRTPVLMIGIVFAISFLYESLILNRIPEKTRKRFIKIALVLTALIVCIVLFYSLNLFNCRTILQEYYIFLKFSQSFIDDERFVLLKQSFALMPKYPFGGQHISSILGQPIHDLLSDIYDYAGVVTYIITIIYCFVYLMNIYKLYKSDKVSNDFKVFILGPFICIVIQMFIEPVMTGSSLFLIVAIIINALVERLLLNE